MLEKIKNSLSSFLYQLSNKLVVILYGGFSSERAVSLNSGNEVYKVLKDLNINVQKYDVTSDITELWNFLIQVKQKGIIFNALHGTFGEDGTLAAILNSLKIPYTHSGVTSSALAMNKFLTKNIAKTCGLLVAKGILVNSLNDTSINNSTYPLVVKPNTEGSSIGVSLVNSEQELKKTLSLCCKKYKNVLIEEFLPGNEYSVGLVNGKALTVTNIIPNGSNVFYNYEAKYSDNGSTHIVPAKVNDNLRDYMLNYAEKLYSTLGCKGIARVDFKEKEQKAYFLEINTHPGLTTTSLLPEQAKFCNICFKELCLFLLLDALNNTY